MHSTKRTYLLIPTAITFCKLYLEKRLKNKLYQVLSHIA